MTRLTAMMGTCPTTQPLKDGTVTSPLVELDFAPIDVAQRGFKDAVRGLKFDVTELALMTFLLAFEAGKPFVLLPFVVNGGFHHKSILCREESTVEPADLAGRTVAMRSYSQTTPAWVRGILSDEYGVRIPDVRWLTQEGAHVEEYEDPPWASRDESGESLEALLRAGRVDAIIAGSGLSGEPGLRPLIPNPGHAAQAWHDRTGVVPINHMVAIRRELAETQPDVVREVLRLLGESRLSGDQLRTCLETGVRFAFEQDLIKKKYAVEDLLTAV